MKISCSQQDLSTALDIVSKAITQNNTLPVLNNILFKASGKNLYLTATNLETAVHLSISAEIQNEGDITIPAKLICGYVGLLEDDKIEIKTEEDNTMFLKTKNSQTKIKGISANEFPIIPKPEKEYTFEIPADLLSQAIDNTVFSAATTPTRPVLSGVFLDVDGGIAKFVATDSYRLAEKKIKLIKKATKPFNCIIPVQTLLELNRVLGIKNGTGENPIVEIHVSKNQILFTFDSIELTSRLIEGKFPDYEKIIPKSTRTKLEVDVARLTNATKRVSLFSRENNNNIKVSAANDGKLQIFTDETRVGEERAEIDIKISGDNNKISLNSQYLLDALNHLKEKAIIEIDEKLTPVVLRPDKKEDYLYIIMPLKQ